MPRRNVPGVKKGYVVPTSGGGSYTYDTSIGLGVSSVDGQADLTKHSGGTYYFVGNGGNDANTGLSHAQRLATFDAAKAKIPYNETAGAGLGDQILMAEGSTFTAGLSNMTGKGGKSAQYPTVIQSYDPNDPTNIAKYGRATSNRPILNTGGGQQFFLQGGGTSPKYIAVRGLEFNPGNVPTINGLGDKTDLNMLANTTGQADYILLENCIFAYTSTGYAQDGHVGGRQQKFIFRKCISYGTWSGGATATSSQGLYLSAIDNATIEDCVFYHNGWKIGATRADTLDNGGSTIFRHPVYAQEDTSGIARRNLFIDGSNDNGSFRGDWLVEQCVHIDGPTGIGIGGGANYNTGAPTGVDFEVRYCAILGDADVTGGATAWGIANANGRSGSSIHHTVIARSRGVNGNGILTQAIFNQPSYANIHDNVIYLWASVNHSLSPASDQTFPAQVLVTANDNFWDDAASGTNENISTGTFPNPYTASELYTALGFADKAAFVAYVIANPGSTAQRQALTLMLEGYAIDTSGMVA